MELLVKAREGGRKGNENGIQGRLQKKFDLFRRVI